MTDDAFVFAELFGYLERTRPHIAAVASRLHRDSVEAVASRSHVHADSLVGHVVEFSTSTRFRCSLEALDAFVWTHFTTQFKDKDGKVSFTVRRTLSLALLWTTGRLLTRSLSIRNGYCPRLTELRCGSQ